MTYEKTGSKTNKDTGKNGTQYLLKDVSTSTLLWTVVKRHKFKLVVTYAVVLSVLYIFPPAPDLLFSLF